MPAPVQRTWSPVDGSLLAERELADDGRIDAVLSRARSAFADWRRRPVAARVEAVERMLTAFLSRAPEIARELSWQMGRPIAHAQGELRGFEERARHMLSIAEGALADRGVGEKPGFVRFIRREPLGVVLTLAPWNYPYLTAVNSIVPAIAAGNVVVLKHSSQTPLCAERLAEAFEAAELREGVFQVLHASHDATARLVAGGVDFVAFTGSVEGGVAIQRALDRRFPGTGLELGGKDPAYVRADADLDAAAAGVMDGAFFNAGQSCCGIERVYVAREVYEPFVERCLSEVRALRLGSPLDEATTLGPLVRPSAAEFVRAQTAEARGQGARALIDAAGFEADREGTPYLAPQVLVDVDHSMRVMQEESFGPVVGIMAVEGDADAVHWMNDSRYGLTASVWTRDLEAALRIGDSIETGTWFMNRCDYLDPALAWTGVKDSGRGCTLSELGYDALTRPKSFHLRSA